ncbi:chloride channel protein [Agaribacterium haliotis]|uniref:chloride channel protein n=1 Tax=Agaribacterium haliotis TaxID=2013869 RepID=UPI000BB52C14|nr:chloride channel protein [Agaribacterium haliotis]
MPTTDSALQRRLNQLRHSLAQVDALPQLSAIAIVIGALCGLLIVAFRLALEGPQHFFSNMSHAEDFEALSAPMRAAVLIGGSLVIALVLRQLNKYQRQLSVAHVIDRVHNHQGAMPASNWLAQFGLAVVAVGSGHSVGREGPAVHIGAGAASQLGQWLRLPNNSMQTLIACGVAAGIAASFDTPLAGVIFAMEVILMEYTIVGFVPVILASVIGAAISKSLIGEPVTFDPANSSMNSLLELSLIALCGFVIAALAGLYIRLNLLASRLNHWRVELRVLLAGLLTAAVAWHVPEIMGLGYDTINSAINGELLLGSLLLIAAAKLLVTPTVVALGIPGGLIGPSLLIGACVGAAIGSLAQALDPGLNINIGLYALLGMAGMMAATINAPLTALVTVLELSHNPGVIFPAMLIIVVSCINTRSFFRVKGIFIEQLKRSGRDIELGPAARALQRTGVFGAMDRRFVVADEQISLKDAQYVLSTQPRWLVFSQGEKLYALWASDLASFIDQAPQAVVDGEKAINLAEVPGRRHMMHAIAESASLYDALKLIRKSQCEVLYVSASLLSHRTVHGVLSLQDIQNHYQPKEMRDALA